MINLGGLGSIARMAGFGTSASDVKRLLGLPDMPAVANAITIANKLRGLAQIGQDATSGQRLSMLSLGMFQFGIETLAYQEFVRLSEYRHAATERLGARPAFQFLGPGAETVSLPGVLIPELTGTTTTLNELREMAEPGDAYPMVASDGRVMGQFIIQKVDERQSIFLPGGVPRRVEFAIDLMRVAD